jgi:hypothetical protein
MRFLTMRNCLSKGRDRDGPFLQAPAFATRTIFLTPEAASSTVAPIQMAAKLWFV